MLDDGAGQSVEVLRPSEDSELLASGSASPSPLSPLPDTPSSPAVLATAHVCTRVQPPPGWQGTELRCNPQLLHWCTSHVCWHAAPS